LVGRRSEFIYGAGNGGLSTEKKWDNPQQAACAEPRYK
jgi:hypothetical protein